MLTMIVDLTVALVISVVLAAVLGIGLSRSSLSLQTLFCIDFKRIGSAGVWSCCLHLDLPQQVDGSSLVLIRGGGDVERG
jgi:hypothetical protein